MDTPLSSSSRIVLWCDGGANQKALAHKVASRFELAGVVIEKRAVRRRLLSRRTAKRIFERLFFAEADDCWRRLLARYQERFLEFPDVETLTVENINCGETAELVRRSGATVVLVSGTRLVRERLLSLPLERGILNLHTGLSPYVRGGPNCTNWCLAEGNFHLIGNTVMWIDAGIDSGNIITTDFVPLTGDENLDEIQWKVMEHAHELYLDAVAVLIDSPETCPSIRQDSIGNGTTYYTRSWGWRQRKRLLTNLNNGLFRDAVTAPSFAHVKSRIRTVPLPGKPSTQNR